MSDQSGEIITFYSYKGGCGRTMALANAAWILAANGKRVLTVDWDLEAPGLDKFYRPFIDQAALSEHLGVSFLITNYESAIKETASRGDQPRAARRTAPSVIASRFTQLAEHVIPVRWEFPSGGRLDFLPAGASNREYGTGMSGFEWDKFMQDFHGDEFIEALRSAMRRDYDYTLIDSRTGMNDVGDLCTALLPDTLVIGFALSDQSLEGASDVAQRVTGYDVDATIRILPVPMRIEDAETDKKDAGLAKAQALFQRYVTGKAPHEYWGKVQIPYKTFYAYEEVLAGFGDRPGQPGSLLAAFERLTDEISDGSVSALPPLPEEERTDFLRTRFTRRKPETPAEILLSYVSEDRPWAEWMTTVLEYSGLRVRTQREAEFTVAPDALGLAVKSAKRIIALVSESYRTALEHDALLGALQLADPGKTRGLVVPCRVDATTVEQAFPTRMLVELDQLDQATALRQLSQILDVTLRAPAALRYPGAKPEIWLVPEKNPNFTGRTKIIDELRELLRAGNTTSLRALHAAGGFGKTQIAIEYADRFKSSYDIVWWIRSEEPNRAVEAMAQLGDRLGLRAATDVATVDRVKDALRRGEPFKRALLIFDNVGQADTIAGLVPVGGSTHILITTRDREVAAGSTAPLNVDTFAREESIALLHRHVPQMERQEADHLAETLGDVPIDIDAAGKYIRETAVSVDDYLARVPVSVRGAVWLAAIEQVQTASPAALRMMELFAYFGGEPVDRAILYSEQFAKVLADYDPVLTVDRALLGDYAAALNRFGLLRIDQVHGFTMHRALQEFLRPRLVEQGVAERARLSVQQILALSRPTSGDTDDPENRAAFARIWPHLSACEAETSTEENVRQLLMDQVRHLSLTGQLTEAEQIAGNLLTLWTAQSGDNDRTVLRLRFLLANVLRNVGRAQESYEIDMDVARRQEDILPENHPERLNTLASVGADLRAVGRFGDARYIDQICYDVTRKSSEHGRAALRAAHNYAFSLAVTGDCYAARDLDRQLYNDEKQIFGYEHPWTLNTAINLGRDLRDCGDYAGSIRLLEAVLRRCKERRGEYDPYTLESAKGLAVALRKAGRHADGLAQTKNVVKAFEAVFGPNGAETLSCKLNFACDLSAAGSRDLALEAAREMREQYEKHLGSTHPHTLASANNVAIYLRTTGKPEDSRELATATFDGLTDVLGAEHPFTLYCAVNLANATADCDLLDEAAALLDAALEHLEAVLGPDHPSTIVTVANRAVVTHRLGLETEAEAARNAALEQLKAALGPDHTTIETFLEWRLANRDLEPYRT
ncbi:tetratricopeptide repeat protein [Catenulispora sp. NL8]|uniref:Tetratricopeptide repeat protein n=1 Tax=Catenulispora pinistramenti TaxID=2705254 RepID=A0ABS5KT86_9ACTN|nr:FxSxx-COOH system tetratricopeptide repeat protein [Catenulispora pinistramenti]MBS2549224.1 tetratricopeptide repeat protein [Catenulispora pinistramenti]